MENKDSSRENDKLNERTRKDMKEKNFKMRKGLDRT